MNWSAGEPDAALAALDAPIVPSERRTFGSLRCGAPKKLHFTTASLADNQCHWLAVLKVEDLFEPAEIVAEALDSGHVNVSVVSNVRLFEIRPPVPERSGAALTVEGQLVPVPASVSEGGERLVVFNSGYGGAGEAAWTILPNGIAPLHGKQPGCQGPLGAAFESSFVAVSGTGAPWHPAAEAWAQQTLSELQESWPDELPLVPDTELTDDAILHGNLVLFGDPGSNVWIAKALSALPIAGWSADAGFDLGQAGAWAWSGDSHGLSLICPNPWAPTKYLALNAGNAASRPSRADYTVVALPPTGNPAAGGQLVQAGYFDNEWQLADSPVPPEDRVVYSWTKPAAGPPSVGAWLGAAGLAEYASAFEDNGYDEVSLLQELTPDETEELAAAVGMKRGHLLKFRRRCLGVALRDRTDLSIRVPARL